jgi:pimeloyl-ACP methyl ester carboxylesterase
MKVRSIRLSAIVAVFVLAAGACGTDEAEMQDSVPTQDSVPEWVQRPPVVSTSGATTTPQPGVEEIRFSSDGFALVGDLVFPDREPPHPTVVVVHGSGAQTRSSTPGYHTVLSTFGEAGYAVLSWDKPGSGDSTGTFDPEHTLTERADILLAGIEMLRGRDDIDPERIGLWGISQAGWVMPLALDQTDDIAFMISVSGGGEDSIEQLAYQLGQNVVCAGGTSADAELIETYAPQAAKGTTYELYVKAVEALRTVDELHRFMSLEINDEDDWRPWPPEIDAYLDPMDIMEHTSIPVLAIFGEFDRYIDPVQGAEAYERALNAAGNQHHRVELVPGVGHTMQTQSDACRDGQGTTAERVVELLDEWIAQLDSR